MIGGVVEEECEEEGAAPARIQICPLSSHPALPILK